MSRFDPVVRWTLSVSRGTDVALRTWLAQSGLRKGDLSRFVEDAVAERLVRLRDIQPDIHPGLTPVSKDPRPADPAADPELTAALEEWRQG
jgi:hypothetical protein